MDIRFVSSLTTEDENRIAGALVGAVQLLLQHFPIAYALRVETSSAKVFQHTQFAPPEDAKPAVTSTGGMSSGHPLAASSSTEH